MSDNFAHIVLIKVRDFMACLLCWLFDQIFLLIAINLSDHLGCAYVWLEEIVILVPFLLERLAIDH